MLCLTVRTHTHTYNVRTLGLGWREEWGGVELDGGWGYEWALKRLYLLRVSLAVFADGRGGVVVEDGPREVVNHQHLALEGVFDQQRHTVQPQALLRRKCARSASPCSHSLALSYLCVCLCVLIYLTVHDKFKDTFQTLIATEGCKS